ncbi:MAG: diacylglycerol kinase family lipid kinase [Oscillospiraceae bacterium]|nr:diacylglycerol kinase family lipid kinase [Oscillospiraceae bacterium]
MRHIFVVNPQAGQKNCRETIRDTLESVGGGYDWSLYETRGPGDATDFVCRTAAGAEGPVRFYACGGDGTLNEVAAGAAGAANASVGVVPCGSGNDYVKHFGGKAPFLDLAAQLAAPEVEVDLMKVGDRIAVNICNFGFDAVVAGTMNRIKRKPVVGGRNAYTTGVLRALAVSMKNDFDVYADGDRLNGGRLLLCSVANGSYYGGKYCCAPNSVCGDGLLDVCVVLPISRIKFVQLLGSYTRGDHLEDPRFAPHIVYRRSRAVQVRAPEGSFVCLDGEIAECSDFTVEVMERAMRLALPAGAAETGRLPAGVTE